MVDLGFTIYQPVNRSWHALTDSRHPQNRPQAKKFTLAP